MELDDVEDFEALPGTASPAVHMLAGGMAGMLEHCAMYPFDVVKVRRGQRQTVPVRAAVGG